MSSISYELYRSKLRAANGLATLRADGKIPVNQFPAGYLTETYKGEFSDTIALADAYPTAFLGDYAYVTAYNSYWYWNDVIYGSGAWVSQEITETLYNSLSAAEKAAVPYIVTAD